MSTSSWINRLFGSSSESSNQANTNNLPGHFPTNAEESVQPVSRGVNSHFLSNAAESARQWVTYLVIKPVVVIVVVMLNILARFLQILYFKDVQQQGRYLGANTATTNSNALINDPISKVDRFVRDLEENLLPQQQFLLQNSDSNLANLPPFFHGSYTQALYMATHRAKYLFVYLTNPRNESLETIFHRVITNQKFISIFTSHENANQNIIWGGDLTNLEAYQLANSLNVTKFPFLGLLCLTRTSTMTPQGPSKSAPKISLILKIQGGIGPDQDADTLILNKFIKRMVKYDTELISIRNELREKYMSEVMRRQQDMDFQRSLLRDKRKKEEKANRKLTEQYLQWRLTYFLSLMADADRTNKAKVALKLVDGSRITFYFHKEAPISDIFEFVELHSRGMLQGDVAPVSDSEARVLFKDFSMPYRFRLVSAVPPRQVLNDLDRSAKIMHIDYVYPSGLLMVESL